MAHQTMFKAPSKRRLVAVAALLLLPSIVLAGGKATLIANTESMQVAGQTVEEESNKINIIWSDADTLRMDFDDPSHYLIMRDGKTYTISQEGGETLVMDMEGMSVMIQAMSGKDSKKDPFGSIDSLESTKTNETVAGITGQVYHMTWTEADGSQKSADAVLTDNPLVVEMTYAYLNSVGAITGAEGIQRFLDELPKNKHGMLKVGDQFYLESIEKTDPPASTFELPAKPVNLQDMLKGQMPN